MEGSREDISQLVSSLRKLDSEKILERKVCVCIIIFEVGTVTKLRFKWNSC